MAVETRQLIYQALEARVKEPAHNCKDPLDLESHVQWETAQGMVLCFCIRCNRNKFLHMSIQLTLSSIIAERLRKSKTSVQYLQTVTDPYFLTHSS